MEVQKSIKLGTYRNFKGGIYEVLEIATHSETMEEMVVYRNRESGKWWVRPASMWNETVERDGHSYLRFTYLGDSIETEEGVQ
ncbi:MAG: DUF1653 domain-containing protein [Clostridia bacterium]|nr:DUF1653 domain-containing protein [Clostridia bacterium]